MSPHSVGPCARDAAPDAQPVSLSLAGWVIRFCGTKLAKYSSMTIETTTTNKSACEICGRLPEDAYTRNQVARDNGARYVKTRTNRSRVERYYADLAGKAEIAGKLACQSCYRGILNTANEVQITRDRASDALLSQRHKTCKGRESNENTNKAR